MTDETAPRIAHYRVVDDRLLAGAQPNQDEYVALADQGVTTVIDLRAGTRIDPNLDDAVFLADLGIRYIPLPLPDGHAPSPELARTAIAQIQLAQGRVYLHCAAGVGRTTSVEMAYRAYSGMEHGVAQQLAVGPPSVEQLWFVRPSSGARSVLCLRWWRSSAARSTPPTISSAGSARWLRKPLADIDRRRDDDPSTKSPCGVSTGSIDPYHESDALQGLWRVTGSR